MNRKIRTILAFLIRLALRSPLVILSSTCYGLSELFEKMGDGLNHSQKILKPLSSAPFIYDFRNELDEMKEDDRKRMLKSLRGELDT